jgi:hypothetical protein
MRPSAARHWPVWNKLVWRATWVRLSVLTPGFLFLLSRPVRLDSRRGVALHFAWDRAEGEERHGWSGTWQAVSEGEDQGYQRDPHATPLPIGCCIPLITGQAQSTCRQALVRRVLLCASTRSRFDAGLMAI